MKNKVAYLGMFVYALLVGFSFLASKNSVGLATPLQTMTFRFTVAFIVMGLAVALKIIKVDYKGGNKLHLLATSATYVAFLGFQAFALEYTTSIVSGILFAIVPILSRIFAGIILKEKSTALQNVFMCLSVFSVIALFLIGSLDSLKALDARGVVLLILSSTSCAVSNVMMRYVKQSYSPGTISLTSFALGCAFFWLFSIVQNTACGTWDTFFEPLKNTSFLISVIYLGIGCTVISGVLMSWSLRWLPAVNATIWGNMSTAISVVAGALVLHEKLYAYQIICTVLIIIGVVGISVFTQKKQKEV